MANHQPNTGSHTICLHHNDTDGRASAAIVRKALGSDVWLCEMDYGDSLPLERILSADHIVLVDFSLPKEEMIQLASYHQFTWIDHHKSAIEELADVSQTWAGTRDTNEAACVLTWLYLLPHIPVPHSIKLIGDRDIWRWAEEDTGAFNEGLFQLDTRPLNDSLWNPLLEDDRGMLEQIIQHGKVLRTARLKDIRRTIHGRGFTASIEGHHALVVNQRGSGDLGQQIRDLGYEMAYCYIDNYHQGEITTFVTLYSSSVDVSILAQQFGGGGHEGAAGFHFQRRESPFPPGLNVVLEKYRE
jgi:oligoribonuclease NrnB/cAMP/cGMP phosphodiesterase (DHH superfamily)